jgi:hypothetical protein
MDSASLGTKLESDGRTEMTAKTELTLGDPAVMCHHEMTGEFRACGALPFWAFTRLAHIQEPGGTCSQAGARF